jgi:DNA-binding NarL/FixJ family response regulator
MAWVAESREKQSSRLRIKIGIPVTQDPRPRVLLADDYVGLLTAWRRLLEPSYDVVGCVRDGRALLEAASTLAPDVVIADLSMPELSGLDACRHIKQASPQTKVILVTAGGDQWVARAAFRAGASGFVLKHTAADDLLVAIHTALMGETYCTPGVGLDAFDVH